MRWDDGGDDGVDGGYDVDDDPDDARRDGDDDGSDSPLREGNYPVVFSLPELFFSLSSFRLVEAAEKLFVDTPDVFRSKGSNTPKGSQRGPHGPGAGTTCGLGWARGRGRLCPLELASMRPFGSVTYFPKSYPPNFSGIFGASDVRYLER